MDRNDPGKEKPDVAISVFPLLDLSDFDPPEDFVVFNQDPTLEDVKQAAEDEKLIVVIEPIETAADRFDALIASTGKSKRVAFYVRFPGTTEEQARGIILDSMRGPDVDMKERQPYLGKTAGLGAYVNIIPRGALP